MNTLCIISPKRSAVSDVGWDGFFPYYAGFPLQFAETILKSANLPSRSIVFDPWNGSGTTSHAASRLGHVALGQDINPVMVVVGKARSLARSEADSLLPMLHAILETAHEAELSNDDPLRQWFGDQTASNIRGIEQSIRENLVGGLDRQRNGSTAINNLSGFASAFYVSLFAVCRSLASDFKCSNPTWVRVPKTGERKAQAQRRTIEARLKNHITSMARALSISEPSTAFGDVHITIGDSTALSDEVLCDFVLTSPPYCDLRPNWSRI